jgi:hypothetical protein
MLVDVLQKINDSKAITGNMWNGNHFLGHPPLKKITLEKFYTEQFSHVNNFFSTRGY